jgi:hypothetical protein
MVENGFAVVVLDNDGNVLNYAIPLNMPYHIVKEAVALGRDVYRVVKTIVKELGYKRPRYITLRVDEYEVTVFDRTGKILIAILYNGSQVQTISQTVQEKAVV